MPRSKKPKYSREDKVLRLAFADKVLGMTEDELLGYIAFAWTGSSSQFRPETATRGRIIVIRAIPTFTAKGQKELPRRLRAAVASMVVRYR